LLAGTAEVFWGRAAGGYDDLGRAVGCADED
jgi:hypothetical protein